MSLARFLVLAAGLSQSLASPVASRAADSTKNLVVLFLTSSSGDSYSTVGFWPGGTLPTPGNPLGNPGLPGQTTANGLNWVGHLTSTLNTTSILTYDFAVSGATVDKDIVDTYAQFCVDDQVAQYKQYVSGKKSASDTLVAVWIGINDLGEPFWDKQAAPISKILDRYFGLLQTLVKDGLNNFVLLTVPPFADQIPAMSGQPATDLNRLRSDITAYNKALSTRVATFLSSNPKVKAIVFDTKPSFDTVVKDFAKYGAKDATCYGSSDCLWTDNYHAGGAIHKLVAQNLVKKLGGNFKF
ncbi:hypothetical protein FZEAL_5412 [Fusarium zealandicum]|uniref:Acetylesterase n=1 Tax=Fusarium zealandicum TaxID=1053134 RepID=A0A8H4XKV8_9HYPO|nr:hypothetical protein FZEAL_5412 [Fusarium zealandicum]